MWLPIRLGTISLMDFRVKVMSTFRINWGDTTLCQVQPYNWCNLHLSCQLPAVHGQVNAKTRSWNLRLANLSSFVFRSWQRYRCRRAACRTASAWPTPPPPSPPCSHQTTRSPSRSAPTRPPGWVSKATFRFLELMKDRRGRYLLYCS